MLYQDVDCSCSFYQLYQHMYIWHNKLSHIFWVQKTCQEKKSFSVKIFHVTLDLLFDLPPPSFCTFECEFMFRARVVKFIPSSGCYHGFISFHGGKALRRNFYRNVTFSTKCLCESQLVIILKWNSFSQHSRPRARGWLSGLCVCRWCLETTW